MRHLLLFLLVFTSLFFYSQNNPSQLIIKQIGKSDTLMFSVSTSGCFDAGITTYFLIKDKCKTRKVIWSKSNTRHIKKITKKNYDTFIKQYMVCADVYKNASPENQTCTMSTEFYLSAKKESIGFINNNCKPEFNPEETLLKLIK